MEIAEAVVELFDLRPASIIERFVSRTLSTNQQHLTDTLGESLKATFGWERTDMAETLT